MFIKSIKQAMRLPLTRFEKVLLIAIAVHLICYTLI